MEFNVEGIAPWGRSFDEYVAMFGLSDGDLKKRILGCGDGPASFNANLSRRGGSIVSVDPIYEFGVAQISSRIDETYEKVIAQLRAKASSYVWTAFSSPEDVGKARMAAMREFLADYEEGKKSGRYVVGALPSLPFSSNSFDIALSSHFLFLYSRQLSADFHMKAILELIRVADEVRIFPILTLEGTGCQYFGAIIAGLLDRGCDVRLSKVNYEFQKGGNEMLVVRRV